jgi:membrane protein
VTTEERNNFLNIKILSLMSKKVRYLLEFILYVLKRYANNRCSSIAAELTVTSLLALVPLTTVIFALLAFIPSFQELGAQLQSLAFKYFVPGTGETIQTYINEFVGKARHLSGVGTMMLLVTALLMMRTIDASFNKIWQVDSNQSMLRTFLVYWAVLTLGPILLGSSLLVTSYIQSLPIMSDVVFADRFRLALWLPFVMATTAFSVMFHVIPNRKIPIKHALIAAVITALFFELAKWAFTIFVTSFSTYQFIFGALASVPLFLIWIYLCWSIVLLGAEFCHGLDAFEVDTGVSNEHPFIDLVSVLSLLARYQQSGQTLTEEELLSRSKKGKKTLNQSIIENLVASKIVSKGQDQSYCLIVSADKINYLQVFNQTNRSFPSSDLINESELSEESKKSLLLLNKKLEKLLSDHLVDAKYQG